MSCCSMKADVSSKQMGVVHPDDALARATRQSRDHSLGCLHRVMMSAGNQLTNGAQRDHPGSR